MRIAEELIATGPDESISTDELMALTGLGTDGVRGALYDLERLGIVSNDTAITAFVHHGRRALVQESAWSRQRRWRRNSSRTCGNTRTTTARATRRCCISANRRAGAARPGPGRSAARAALAHRARHRQRRPRRGRRPPAASRCASRTRRRRGSRSSANGTTWRAWRSVAARPPGACWSTCSAPVCHREAGAPTCWPRPPSASCCRRSNPTSMLKSEIQGHAPSSSTAPSCGCTSWR